MVASWWLEDGCVNECDAQGWHEWVMKINGTDRMHGVTTVVDGVTALVHALTLVAARLQSDIILIMFT